jgi:hypothetical protein
MPKRRGKKGAEEEQPAGPLCHFEEKIGPPKQEAVPDLLRPDPDKTRPMVEAVA